MLSFYPGSWTTLSHWKKAWVPKRPTTKVSLPSRSIWQGKRKGTPLLPLWDLKRNPCNSEAQLRVTRCQQLETPSSQSWLWPVPGKCEISDDGKHWQRIYTLSPPLHCACFLRQTQIVALFIVFTLLQGGVKGQRRFQVPCDGWRWKTQLHRGMFNTSNQIIGERK